MSEIIENLSDSEIMELAEKVEHLVRRGNLAAWQRAANAPNMANDVRHAITSLAIYRSVLAKIYGEPIP